MAKLGFGRRVEMHVSLGKSVSPSWELQFKHQRNGTMSAMEAKLEYVYLVQQQRQYIATQYRSIRNSYMLRRSCILTLLQKLDTILSNSSGRH